MQGLNFEGEIAYEADNTLNKDIHFVRDETLLSC